MEAADEDDDVDVVVEDVEMEPVFEEFGFSSAGASGSPTTSSCRSSCLLLPDWIRCSAAPPFSPLPDDGKAEPGGTAAKLSTMTLVLFSMVNVTMSVAAPRTLVRLWRPPEICGVDRDDRSNGDGWSCFCCNSFRSCFLGLEVTGVSGGVGGVSWTESGRKRTAC